MSEIHISFKKKRKRAKNTLSHVHAHAQSRANESRQLEDRPSTNYTTCLDTAILSHTSLPTPPSKPKTQNQKPSPNMPLSPNYPDPSSLHRHHHHQYSALHLHEAENALSSLLLIALLTYFYTAFGKIIQPGGRLGRGDAICRGKQAAGGGEEARQELGSPIYYSSPAAA